MGTSVGLLVIVIAAPLWLPALLRAFVPDRYIAAYFPEAIQQMVYRHDPAQMLPTTEAIGNDTAAALLEQLGPMPTPLPTIASPGGSAPLLETTPEEQPSPTAAFVPADGSSGSVPPGSVILSGFEHSYQMWNNCGPATLSTYLSYYGVDATQQQVQVYVKPNIEDRNVRPEELQAYTRSVGLDMLIRINGNINLLRRLIDAGYPVMIEKGFDPEPDRLGWMGHYLLLYGYNDTERTFWTMDSYLGPGQREPYDHIDAWWRHFNRVYMVAYRPEQAAEVAALIGADMDDAIMIANALAAAQADVQNNLEDPFGWFNLGSVLAAAGDYENAATAFDVARSKGTPWRMLWYQFGPYEAYLHVGGDRLYDVIALAESILSNNEYSEEAYYYRGLALAALGNSADAIADFNRALKYNPHFEPALSALASMGG
jgi:tetratricopeptide (TPR) repeat protein